MLVTKQHWVGNIITVLPTRLNKTELENVQKGKREALIKMASYTRIKFPTGFWAGLHQLGITPHEVIRKAGLPLTIINEPVVNTSQYFSIWQAYSDLIDDTAKGIIKLATGFETVHYQPIVLAAYHARDYRDVLTRMARYKQMCPPENLLITEGDEKYTIELKWLNTEQPGPSMLIGITLAFLLELGRKGTAQPLTAKSVEFSRSMGNVESLEEYFGCHIQIILHRSDLEKPFVSYNEELLEVLTPVLDQSIG